MHSHRPQVPSKVKCPNFKKYDEKGHPHTYLKLHAVAMPQYGDDDKLLVQNFQ